MTSWKKRWDALTPDEQQVEQVRLSERGKARWESLSQAEKDEHADKARERFYARNPEKAIWLRDFRRARLAGEIEVPLCEECGREKDPWWDWSELPAAPRMKEWRCYKCQMR